MKESNMQCPHCGSEKNCKNGKVNGGKQRYKCGGCSRNYTEHPPRGYPLSIKMQAIQLFREGMGFRAIGRILNVSNVTVLLWIRHFGREIQQWYDRQIWQEYNKEIPIVEIDEIWHFCEKNSSKSGFGLLFAVNPESSSPLKWAIVPLKR